MGNCLSSQSADDLSLLNDSEGASLPGEPPPPYQERAAQHLPVFQPSGGHHHHHHHHHHPPQLSEEEQVRLALRIGLIQHLPRGVYQPSQLHPDKRNKECVICMMDFELGDAVRYLPCLHTYHVDCIDAWLMRSFTCPSCLEPVDAALLCSYQTN